MRASVTHRGAHDVGVVGTAWLQSRRSSSAIITTRTRVVRIGNSQGVRLSKPLLEASGLSGEVGIEAVDGQIVIRKATHPGDGWEEAAREMHANGDDALLDPECASEWDQTEWTWGDNTWDE